MAERILTLRELNRATLARQLLLDRSTGPTLEAVSQLVGLQAQSAMAPYVGLWTRLSDFRREDLAQAIEDRKVIKTTLMRATLHLCTVEDYLLIRTALQPILTAASEAIVKSRDSSGIDMAEVIETARTYIAEQPRTFEEISSHLSGRWPDRDIGAMRYTVRTHLHLVQVPTDTGWSYPGNPKFTLVESWLGKSIDPADNFRALIYRYLAAFGPATIADMQTWSGFSKLKGEIEKLKPDLTVYRDEKRRELFDLTDLPLPEQDTVAAERFLPEYDNLLLSHYYRTRIIADEYRSKVFLPGLRVRSTILVDGFVRGAWKVEKTKSAATLIIEPFEPLTVQSRQNLLEEGERLVRFTNSDAKSFEVRFTE